MPRETRTALWVAVVAVVSGLIAWAFSFSGSMFATVVLSVPLPDWYAGQRESLLAWEAVGLLVAFLLALLAVRRWSAPPHLWLGTLAASVLLAGSYVEGIIEVSRSEVYLSGTMHNVLYATPFFDPYVALFALVGLPIVVGLACRLASRRMAQKESE